MREETLFTIETPYRQPLEVKGWYFGDPGEKTLAVMGALRGNEVQQMHICARLIQALKALEEGGKLAPGCGVLVIPCANPFSMNVGRRFWAADNTDINRMFPGYDKGETTQRLASRIFSALQGYRYGVQMASMFLPGRYLPHLRMMETAYHSPEPARSFGLPYVLIRRPRPYDTTTLNYNWQIWDTHALSLYSGETEYLDPAAAQLGVEAVLRFLRDLGLCQAQVDPGQPCRVLQEEELTDVLSSCGGLLLCRVGPGDQVACGQELAEIQDPCTGQVLERLRAGKAGRVFFVHRHSLINGHDVAFRILPEEVF